MRKLWELLKFWFVATVVITDEGMIRAYEIALGDPLQARGLSLFRQFQLCGTFSMLFLISDVLTAPHMLDVCVDMLCALTWASVVFVPFVNQFRKERLSPPPEDAIGFNVLRYYRPQRMLRVVVEVTLISAIGLRFLYAHSLSGWDYASVLYVVSFIIDACQPKPPRPRREKRRVLVPVTVSR